MKSRYASNPKPKRTAARGRYAADPEAKRTAERSRYASNPEPKRKAEKSRYASNPEPKKIAATKRYTKYRSIILQRLRTQYSSIMRRRAARLLQHARHHCRKMPKTRRIAREICNVFC